MHYQKKKKSGKQNIIQYKPSIPSLTFILYQACHDSKKVAFSSLKKLNHL